MTVGPTYSFQVTRRRWLTTAEAAELLGVRPRTVYRLIDHDRLPAYRFGRVIRLLEADVDQWAESQRVRPGDLVRLYPMGLIKSRNEPGLRAVPSATGEGLDGSSLD